MKDRANTFHIMWYQSAGLITVQIDVLFGEFVSVKEASIGNVAAILMLQIEEEEVDSVKFKFYRRMIGGRFFVSCCCHGC